MKYRYTKYTGDLLDEIDLEDLVSKLSDLLLSSGFSNPWGARGAARRLTQCTTFPHAERGVKVLISSSSMSARQRASTPSRSGSA